MRSLFLAICILLVSIPPLFAAPPQDQRQEQVISLIEEAIHYYDKVGRTQAITTFSDRDGEFSKGEFYVILTELDGTHIAHINHGLIGRNLWNLKDLDGDYIVRGQVNAGKSDPKGGWTSYLWTEPTSKKVKRKHTFVRIHDNIGFMSGFYE